MTKKLSLISAADIENRFRMGRSLLAKEEALGKFPRSIKISSSTGRSAATAWIEFEVQEYFRDKIAESRPDLDVDALFSDERSSSQNNPLIHDRG
jgi:predicted DNA-binding transcriptional regulator AlpA